jgi:hypothetical protein
LGRTTVVGSLLLGMLVQHIREVIIRVYYTDGSVDFSNSAVQWGSRSKS